GRNGWSGSPPARWAPLRLRPSQRFSARPWTSTRAADTFFMPQTKQESLRKAKANEAALAKQKQLDAVTHDTQAALTTPAGAAIADNHNSLKAGTRGPLLA